MAQGAQGLAAALCREPAADDQQSRGHGRAACRAARKAPPRRTEKTGKVSTLRQTVAGPNQLSTRTIVRVFFTLVALGVLLYTLYLVRSVLGLLLISVFLAVALGPAVDHVRDLKLPRPASILAVFLALFLAIFLIGLIVVPPIVEEVQAFAEDVPTYIDDIRENETLRDYDDKYDITAKLEEQASSLPSRLGDAAGALQAVTVGVFSTILQLVTVLTITFFLLLDGGRIVNFLLAQLRPRHAGPHAQDGGRHLRHDRRLRRRGAHHRHRRGGLDLRPAQHPRRAVRGPARGADGVLRADPARRLDDRRRARRGGDPVRRLPRRPDRLGRVRRRLPAGREQRAAAARLPAHGQPAPARGDHRDPHRVEPARGARRARRDPDRGRHPDRPQGRLGPPRVEPRRASAASRSRRATSRRARSSCRRGRSPRSCRGWAAAAAPPARPRARATARAAAAARPR